MWYRKCKARGGSSLTGSSTPCYFRFDDLRQEGFRRIKEEHDDDAEIVLCSYFPGGYGFSSTCPSDIPGSRRETGILQRNRHFGPCPRGHVRDLWGRVLFPHHLRRRQARLFE